MSVGSRIALGRSYITLLKVRDAGAGRVLDLFDVSDDLLQHAGRIIRIR